MGIGADIPILAHPVSEIAQAVTRLFLAADNAETRTLLDLDPRAGYVRLGETQTEDLRSFGIDSIRGMMNVDLEFQAILEGQFGSAILTNKIKDGLTLTLLGC